jgi:signal transduction histidine kinase
VNDRRIKTVEPNAPSFARDRKRSGNRSNRMHPECDTPAHRTTARELNEEGRPTGMEVVDHCAARIAHDLNNLLSTICGYGTLALRQASGGETSRCIHKVLKASARAQVLTQQLFALGRIPPNPNVPVYIQGTVEEALEWMAITLPEGVQLQTDLRAEKVRVLADETQLYQIVMNLCTNAARAMEHRGVLSVALDEVSVPFAQATTHGSLRSGVYVRLSVRDNGSGIPPGVLEHIFDPFFTTRAASGGIGLGLAIVSNIVHALGGAIDIRTEVGVGTTFVVWLGASVSDTVAIGTALLASDHS